MAILSGSEHQEHNEGYHHDQANLTGAIPSERSERIDADERSKEDDDLEECDHKLSSHLRLEFASQH